MKKWISQNKQLLAVLVLLFLSILLIAVCIIDNFSKNTSSSTNESNTVETALNDESTESIPDTDNSDVDNEKLESEEESTIVEEEEVPARTFYEDRLPEDPTYSAILQNTAEIYFDSFTNDTYFELEDCFESGKAYKLDDLKNALIELDYVEEDSYDPAISYAYMDLGADGTQELAVTFDIGYVYGKYDLTYILKKENDKIQAVYAYTISYERGEYDLNYYGYGSSEYNVNGSVHGADYTYLTVEGEPHFVYGIYYIGGLESCGKDFSTPGISEVASDYYVDSESIYTYVYYFDENTYPHEDVMRTFYVEDPTTYEFMDQSMTFNDQKYRAIFDDTGTAIVDENTVDATLNEHEKLFGITDAIINGKNLEFTYIYE